MFAVCYLGRRLRGGLLLYCLIAWFRCVFILVVWLFDFAIELYCCGLDCCVDFGAGFVFVFV